MKTYKSLLLVLLLLLPAVAWSTLVFFQQPRRPAIVGELPSDATTGIVFDGSFFADPSKETRWVVPMKRKSSDRPLFTLYGSQYIAQRKANFFGRASWMDIRRPDPVEFERVRAQWPQYNLVLILPDYEQN